MKTHEKMMKATKKLRGTIVGKQWKFLVHESDVQSFALPAAIPRSASKQV